VRRNDIATENGLSSRPEDRPGTLQSVAWLAGLLCFFMLIVEAYRAAVGLTDRIGITGPISLSVDSDDAVIITLPGDRYTTGYLGVRVPHEDTTCPGDLPPAVGYDGPSCRDLSLALLRRLDGRIATCDFIQDGAVCGIGTQHYDLAHVIVRNGFAAVGTIMHKPISHDTKWGRPFAGSAFEACRDGLGIWQGWPHDACEGAHYKRWGHGGVFTFINSDPMP